MRQRYGAAVIGVALLGVSSGCQSLGKAPGAPGVRVIIPVDDRPTQQALTTPPAISGGTLTVTLDGRFAVAADPDRDRVSIVELSSGNVQQVALNPGDEPGRVVVDGASHAFVALRRAGDVVSIDLSNASVDGRTHVCSAPRGMAFDWDAGVLHVACADGHLVTIKPTGEMVRDVTLDTDLRDVIVHGDHLLVSTFKQAELLSVDDTGVVSARNGAAPFSSEKINTVPSDDGNNSDTAVAAQPMTAHLAWRMTQNATGEVFMLHQGESQGVIDIGKPGSASDMGASPYGGSGGCSAVVGPALTHINADGSTQTSLVASGVLSVDLAVSARTGQVAIVQAGQADASAPHISTIDDGAQRNASPSIFPGSALAPFPGSVDFTALLPEGIDKTQISQSQVSFPSIGVNGLGNSFPGASNCEAGPQQMVPGQATAVAFTPTGDMIVQSREPALLIFMPASSVPIAGAVPTDVLPMVANDGTTATTPSGSAPNVISLGGASMRDTGHEIFHRDAGGGIACASCHAEGAEDGHTWQFTGLGKRRTQALHIGLEGTEPFHWGGDEADLGHVMEDVFVGRMGGVHQGTARLGALSDWLFSLRPPTPITSPDDAAAVRGKVLFESGATGCTECHSGAKFTNNKTVDVGTGGKFQVPSLIGVGYRAPLMHTGCAATLADRFDPECGGTQHGKTDQLNEQNIADMVAYLQTL